MTEDNALNVLLLSWILYCVATEAWIRGMALCAVGIISVSVIVKFFV